MKKFILIILTIVFVNPVFSQDMFQQLTGKYADKDGFSATLLTNDMFDLYLRKKNIEKDSPVYETLKKLNNILVASQSKYGTKTETDLSGIHTEILDHYKKGNYALFKTEKRMGEDVKVYLKKTDTKITSLALVTYSSVSVNLVEMNGDIDMSGLGELGKALNVRGIENLYKVNGSASSQVWGEPFIFPDPDINNSFLEERLKGLEDQKYFSEEQQMQFEKQAKEMVGRQAEMAEKYREMAEKYQRQPIFLTSPGDTNTVYYLNGKKVKADEIKKLEQGRIATIDVTKGDKKGDKTTVRIRTK